MGVGTPLDLVEAVHRGVDLFDCVLPTSHAAQGTAFTRHGIFRLRRSVYKLDQGPVDGSPVDARVAPLIQRDSLRKQFGTVPIGVTGDRVDPQPHADPARRRHADRRVPTAPSGKLNTVGEACPEQGRPWAWSRVSAANTTNALLTRRTTPSG